MTARWHSPKQRVRDDDGRVGTLVPITLLVAPVTLSLTSVLGGSLGIRFSAALACAPGAILIAVYLLGRQRFGPPDWRVGLPLIGFALVFIVAVVRQAEARSVWDETTAFIQLLEWGLLGTGAALAALHAQRAPDGSRVGWAICLAPTAFVVVNVILQVAGWRPSALFAADSGQSELVGALGVRVARVSFPLVFSPNAFGILAGASLTICLLLALARASDRLTRIGALGGTAVSLYGLALSDSRGALFAAILAVAMVSAFSRRGRFFLLVPVLVAPVSAFIVVEWTSQVLSGGLARSLTRGNASEVTSGRIDLVWRPVSKYLLHGDGGSWTGHGLYGQTTTGIANAYSTSFERVRVDSRSTSVHSLGLQTALDMGWLGLIVLTLLVVAATWALVSLVPSHVSAGLGAAALVYFALASVTEAVPSVYNPASFACWIMLMCLALPRNGVGRGP